MGDCCHIMNKMFWLVGKSVATDGPDGHLSGNVSKKSADFAYAAGVIINPVGNMSVNVGYEGSKADFYGKHYCRSGL